LDYKYQASSGEIYSISLIPQSDGSYTVIIGERSYVVCVERAQPGKFLLKIDNQAQPVYAVQDSGNFYVSVNGRTLMLEKVVGSGRGSSKHQHAGDLTSTMPGQILEVLVSEGQTVEKGQTLVIMEAMKMEMRIKAPYDGVVTHLLCAAGNTVDRGQLLVEVQPQEPNA
jgi:biotin carboxyl carrier protein